MRHPISSFSSMSALLFTLTLLLTFLTLATVRATNEQEAALLLDTTLTDRSIFTFSTLNTDGRATNILPPTTPPPPPLASGAYPTTFKTATLSGSDRSYIDINSPTTDGGSRILPAGIFSTSSYSFATWFYADDLTRTANQPETILLSCTASTNAAAGTDLVIVITSLGQLAVKYFDNRAGPPDTYGVFPTSLTPLLKTWNHISITYNQSSSTYTYYLNGIPSSGNWNPGSFTPGSTPQCHLGRSQLKVWAKDRTPFRGSFFGTAFVAKLLNDTQILYLASPRSAVSILASTNYKYSTLTYSGNVQAFSQNPLTTTTLPWNAYKAYALSSGDSIDLSLGFGAPRITSVVMGGAVPMTLSFFIKFSVVPIPTGTFLYYSFSSTQFITLSIQYSAATSVFQVNHGAYTGMNCLGVNTGTNTYVLSGTGPTVPLTNFALFTLILSGTQATCYINGRQSTFTSTYPTQTAATFNTAKIGSDGVATPTLAATIFGLHLYPTTALSPSDLATLAQPTTTSFTVTAPNVVPEGSTFPVTITPRGLFANAGTTGTSNLLIASGDGTTVAAVVAQSYTGEVSNVSLWLATSTTPTQSLTVTSTDSSYPITLPTPKCIEVIDPTQVQDTGFTVLTAEQLLQNADLYLPMTAPFNGSTTVAGTSMLTPPSGLVGQQVLSLVGGVSAQLQLTLDSPTDLGNVSPWVGFRNAYEMTIVAWVQSTTSLASGNVGIFYAYSALGSNADLVSFSVTGGVLTFEYRAGTQSVCLATSTTSISGSRWYHVAATFGAGGCTVSVDGAPTLGAGTLVAGTLLPYGAGWNTTWIPSSSIIQRPYAKIGGACGSACGGGTAWSGQFASFAFFNRMLSQREIIFLASSKPANLIPPSSSPRKIALNITSSQALLSRALFSSSCSRQPIAGHGILLPPPSGLRGSGVLFFNATTQSGLDLTQVNDTLDATTSPWNPTTILQSTTISVWVSLARFTGDIIVRLGNAGGVRFDITAGPQFGRITFTYNTVGLTKGITTNGTINTNQFVHIAAVWDEAACFVYINGVLSASGRMIGGYAVINPVNIASVGGTAAGGGGIKMQGTVAGVAIWQYALTTEEVKTLARNPPQSIMMLPPQSVQSTAAQEILLSSDYDFIPPISLSSATPVQIVDPQQKDGAGVINYVNATRGTFLRDPTQIDTGMSYNFPNLISPTITISAWFSLAASGTGCIFDVSPTATRISIFQGGTSLSDLHLYVNSDDTTAAVCDIAPFGTGKPGGILTAGTWYHVAFSLGSECRGYLNGVLIQTVSTAPGATQLYSGVKPVSRTTATIGACNAVTTTKFAGSVAQLTVWQRELSEVEVAVLSASPPPSISRLITPSTTLPSFNLNYLQPLSIPSLSYSYDYHSTGSGNITKAGPLILNDHLDASFPGLVGGGSSITISMWIKIQPNVLADKMRIFEASDLYQTGSLPVNLIAINAMADGSVQALHTVDLADGSASYSSSVQTKVNAYLIGKWHVITVIWDVDALATKIYVDGGLLAFGGWKDGVRAIPPLVNRPYVAVAGSQDSTTPSITLSIGDVNYWNIALPTDAIVDIARNPPNAVTNVQTVTSDTQLLASSPAPLSWPTTVYVPTQWNSASGGYLLFTSVGTSFNSVSLDTDPSVTSDPSMRVFPSAVSHTLSDGITLAIVTKFIVLPSATSYTKVFDWLANSQADRLSIQVSSGHWQLVSYVAGVSVCTIDFTGMTLTLGWTSYVFTLFPNNRASLWINGVFNSNQPCTAASFTTTTNIAQAMILSTNGVTAGHDSAKLGGSGMVDGTSIKGLSGYVMALQYWSRILRPSEIEALSLQRNAYILPTPVRADRGLLSTATALVSALTPASPSSMSYDLGPSDVGPGSVITITAPTGSYSVVNLNTDITSGNATTALSLSEFTVAGWLYFSNINDPPDNPIGTRIFDFGPTNNTGNIAITTGRMWMAINSPSTGVYNLRLQAFNSKSSSIVDLQAGLGIALQRTWLHYAVTVTANGANSALRLYINGGLAAIGQLSEVFPAVSRSFNYLGSPATQGGLMKYGSFAAWSTKLTAAKIYQLYQSPPTNLFALTPQSQNQSLLASAMALYTCNQPRDVLAGLPYTWNAGADAQTGVCSFKATSGHYIDLNNQTQNMEGRLLPTYITSTPTLLEGNQGFSVSFHFTLKSYPANNASMFLLGCGAGLFNQNHMIEASIFGVSTTQLRFEFRVYTASGSVNVLSLAVVSKTSVPLNQPMNFVVSMANDDTPSISYTSLWLNSQLLVTTSTSGGFVTYSVRTLCYFGKAVSTAGAFDGTLARLAFWARPLGQDEIVTLAANTPPAYLAPTSFTASTPIKTYAGYGQTLTLTPNRPLTCYGRMPVQSSTSISFTGGYYNTQSQCNNVQIVPTTNAASGNLSITCQPTITAAEAFMSMQLGFNTQTDVPHAQNALTHGLTQQYTPQFSFINTMQLTSFTSFITPQTINEPLSPDTLNYTSTFTVNAQYCFAYFTIPVGETVLVLSNGQYFGLTFSDEFNSAPIPMNNGINNIGFALQRAGITYTIKVTVPLPMITALTVNAVTTSVPIPTPTFTLSFPFQASSTIYSTKVENSTTAITLKIVLRAAGMSVDCSSSAGGSKQTLTYPNTLVTLPIISNSATNTITIKTQDTWIYTLTVDATKVTPVFATSIVSRVAGPDNVFVPVTYLPSPLSPQNYSYSAGILSRTYSQAQFTFRIPTGDTIQYYYTSSVLGYTTTTFSGANIGGTVDIAPNSVNNFTLSSKQQGTYTFLFTNPPYDFLNLNVSATVPMLSKLPTTWNTSFDPTVYGYAFSVYEGVTSITFSYLLSQAFTISVNGTNPQPSIGSSVTVGIKSGLNHVTLAASSGTYTVMVSATIPAPIKSMLITSTATSAPIPPANLTLSPQFTPSTINYYIAVESSTTSITISSVLLDATTIITAVNNNSATPYSQTGAQVSMTIAITSNTVNYIKISTSVGLMYTITVSATVHTQIFITTLQVSVSGPNLPSVPVSFTPSSFAPNVFLYDAGTLSATYTILQFGYILPPGESSWTIKVTSTVDGSNTYGGTGGIGLGLNMSPGSFANYTFVTKTQGSYTLLITNPPYDLQKLSVASTVPSLQALPFLNQTFTPTQYYYSVTTYKELTSLSFAVNLTKAVSVFVNGTSSLVLLGFATSSGSIGVTPGATTTISFSTSSGRYFIYVNAVIAPTLIDLAPTSTTTLTPIVPASLQMTPTFSPYTYIYAMTVENNTNSITFRANMLGPIGTSLDIDNDGENEQTIYMPISTFTLPIIPNMVNPLRVNTDTGLYYTIVVSATKFTPIFVTSLAPRVSNTQAQLPNTAITFSPALSPLVFFYPVVLSTTYSTITFTLNVQSGDSVALTYLTSNGMPGSGSFPGPLSASAGLGLAIGTGNTFTNYTFTHSKQGTYVFQITNPPYDLQALSVSGSVPTLLPLPTMNVTYSPNTYAYGITTYDNVTQLILSFSLTRGITLNVDSSSQQLSVSTKIAVITIKPGLITTVKFVTSSGTYVIVIYATLKGAEPPIPVDVLSIVIQPSASGSVALTPPFNGGFSFAYNATAAIVPALDSFTFLVTCDAPCSSSIVSPTDGVTVLRTLQPGLNTYPLGIVPPGLTLLKIRGNRNYTLSFTVPPAQPCLGVTCQNSAKCLNQVNTAYNTSYLCFCVGLFEGALCEKPIIVVVPPVVTHPTPVLSPYSTAVTDCQTLTLSGLSSYNLGPQGLSPFYMWNVTSIKLLTGQEILNMSDSKYDSNAASIAFASAINTTLSSTTILPSTSSISITGPRMIDDATYTFSLQVGNTLETSAPIYAIVKKNSLGDVSWRPSIAIDIPTVIRRTSVNDLKVLITPGSCQPIPSDVVITYQWQILLTGKADASSSYPDVSTLPLADRNLTSSLALFSIPANTFRIGYLYSISVDLTMTSASGAPGQRRRARVRARARALLASTQIVHISATQSSVSPTPNPISAVINGGNRQRTISSPYTITASGSRDLDYPIITKSAAAAVDGGSTSDQDPLTGLTFVWTCLIIAVGGGTSTSTSSNTPCNFITSVSPPNLNAPSIVVPPNVMTPDVTYEWRVTVASIYDSSRSAIASVQVKALPAPIIPVPIVSIKTLSTRINIEDTLRLTASVIAGNGSTTQPINMLYSWTLSSSSSSIATSQLPSLLDPSNLAGDVNSSTLAVLQGKLVPGSYLFTVVVSDPGVSIGSGSGSFASSSASASIIVNAKPQPGTCMIDRSSGDALSTIFTMSCQDWFEPLLSNFQPFSYSIEYRDTSIIQGDGTQIYQQLSSASSSPVSSFLLPAGSLLVRTKVTDQLKAYEYSSEISVVVTVPQPALFDFMGQIRNLTEMNLPIVLQSNDAIGSISLVKQIADLISDASMMSQYSDDAASQSQLLGFTTVLLNGTNQAWALIATAAQVDTNSLLAVSRAFLSLTLQIQRFPSTMITTTKDLLQIIVDSSIASKLSIDASSSAYNLGVVVSRIMSSCTQLDYVSDLVHEILRLRQKNAVSGESLSIDTLQYSAYVKRSLVAAGSEISLPSGQSVILSATAMTNYAQKLNQLNLSNIDTTTDPSSTQAEMDTRIITFAQQWSLCRGGASDGSTAISQLTSIELTFPNGDKIDIADLDSDIEFTLPISANSTQSAFDKAQSELCFTTDTIDKEQIAKTQFTCQFWNVSSQSYSTQGCKQTGVTFNDDGSATLKCSCSHLTEFAILYAESKNAGNSCVNESKLGDSVYLIFLIIYVGVGAIAFIQLLRIIVSGVFMKFWIISAEHILITLICIFRALNMAMYYTLYKSLSISTQTIISGLPYLFYSWIFTIVIFTWASIWSTSTRGEKNTNPLRPYRSAFILCNIVISFALFIVFGLMSATSNLDELSRLNRVGVSITCAVEIGFAVFLVSYGLLLVRALTQHFVSAYATKLGFIAVALSSAFIISASFLAYSAAQPDAYGDHLIAYNSVYFALDIVGLILVMVLFARSISKSEEVGSSKGSTNYSSSRPVSATSNRLGSRSNQKSKGDSRAESEMQPRNPRVSQPVARATLDNGGSHARAMSGDVIHIDEEQRHTPPDEFTMTPSPLVSAMPPSDAPSPPPFTLRENPNHPHHVSSPSAAVSSPPPPPPTSSGPPPLPLDRPTSPSAYDPAAASSSSSATSSMPASPRAATSTSITGDGEVLVRNPIHAQSSHQDALYDNPIHTQSIEIQALNENDF